jgi:hypothetical protein
MNSLAYIMVEKAAQPLKKSFCLGIRRTLLGGYLGYSDMSLGYMDKYWQEKIRFIQLLKPIYSFNK